MAKGLLLQQAGRDAKLIVYAVRHDRVQSQGLLQRLIEHDKGALVPSHLLII